MKLNVLKTGSEALYNELENENGSAVDSKGSLFVSRLKIRILIFIGGSLHLSVHHVCE